MPVSRAKRRLLFVDDEPAILDALQAVLRRQRHEWDMVFAVGGAAGLAQIDNSSFDVVVTDMRMPGINGAELLRQVKSKQPHAVRLVLSGQTDTETAMKTVFTAHQFLAKPCDAEQLLAVVKRACELNELVSREELRSLAGDITLLPSAPRTFLAISVALSTPSCSIDDIAQIIERDPALCAKVLQVANSAFFGLPRTVTSVASAATYLGTLTLRNLALAMETLAVTGKQRPLIPSVRLEAFQLNSLFVGLLARQWFENDRHKGDDAFVAGMLRDLGHFVLLNQPLEPRASPESHAMLSAYLLGLWGIPHSVLEPVAFHEHPEQLEHETLEIVDVVHLADRICGELLPSPFQAEPGALDTERLARLGVTSERIEQLRGQAVKLLPQVKALLGS